MKKIFKIILYIIVILALAVCLFFLIDTLQEKNKEVSNTEIKDNFTDNNNLYPHYRAIVKTEKL